MIEVVEPGAATSVQTAPGRIGWRYLGVPVGGAADPWSARLANRLVGNPDDAAVLEVALTGPTLRIHAAMEIAIAGAVFDAALNGLPMPTDTARRVRPGAELRIRSGAGARCYVAFGGGLVVEPVLGSAATDLRTGFGGHEGRTLRSGDRLRAGIPTGITRRLIGPHHTGPMRVVRGPHGGIDGLLASTWTVSGQADRTGARLDGPTLGIRPAEVPSMGLPLGAIQVPSDGRPIVMLADRPVTGGYPVPACVIGADVGRMAGLRPGTTVRFVEVTIGESRELSDEMERRLDQLEMDDTPDPDEAGWAGALE